MRDEFRCIHCGSRRKSKSYVNEKDQQNKTLLGCLSFAGCLPVVLAGIVFFAVLGGTAALWASLGTAAVIGFILVGIYLLLGNRTHYCSSCGIKLG